MGNLHSKATPPTATPISPEERTIAIFRAMEIAMHAQKLERWDDCPWVQKSLESFENIPGTWINADFIFSQVFHQIHTVTLLNFAVEYGSFELCQRLLQHPTLDPNLRNKQQKLSVLFAYHGASNAIMEDAAIHIAIKKGKVPIVTLLLADPRLDRGACDKRGHSIYDLINESHFFCQRLKQELMLMLCPETPESPSKKWWLCCNL